MIGDENAWKAVDRKVAKQKTPARKGVDRLIFNFLIFTSFVVPGVIITLLFGIDLPFYGIPIFLALGCIGFLRWRKDTNDYDAKKQIKSDSKKIIDISSLSKKDIKLLIVALILSVLLVGGITLLQVNEFI